MRPTVSISSIFFYEGELEKSFRELEQDIKKLKPTRNVDDKDVGTHRACWLTNSPQLLYWLNERTFYENETII